MGVGVSQCWGSGEKGQYDADHNTVRHGVVGIGTIWGCCWISGEREIPEVIPSCTPQAPQILVGVAWVLAKAEGAAQAGTVSR